MKTCRKGKWVALVLVVAMLLQICPMMAFAQEEQEPQIVREIIELREENVKQYQMSDGTKMAVIYQRPVHEQVDGKWVDLASGETTVKVTNYDAGTVASLDLAPPEEAWLVGNLAGTNDNITGGIVPEYGECYTWVTFDVPAYITPDNLVDATFAMTIDSYWAERATMPDDCVVPVGAHVLYEEPSNLSFDDFAANANVFATTPSSVGEYYVRFGNGVDPVLDITDAVLQPYTSDNGTDRCGILLKEYGVGDPVYYYDFLAFVDLSIQIRYR